MSRNVSLLKLHIGRFAGLCDLSLEFRPDRPNLVIAANRAGKTTVCEFIRFMFYGMDVASGRFFPWEGERTVSGSLSLLWGNERYDISRMQSGQSAGHVSVVEAATEREVNLGDKTPGEYFLGLDSWLYDRTVYCQQKQNAKIQEDLSVEALDRFAAVFSEGRGVYSEVQRLTDAKNRLMNKDKTGQIDELMARRKEFEMRQTEIERRRAQIIQTEKQLSECENRMADISRQIVLTKAELKDHGDLRAADSLTALKDEIEQNESKLRVLATDARIGQILPNRVAAEELRLHYSDYCRLGAKLTEAKETLMLSEDNLKLHGNTFGADVDEERVEEAKRTVDSSRKWRVFFLSLAVFFAVLGVGVFSLLAFGPAALPIINAALVGLVFAIFTAGSLLCTSVYRMRIDRAVGELGADTLDAFYAMYDEYLAHRRSQDLYREQIAKEQAKIRALQERASEILGELSRFAPGVQGAKEICESCVNLLNAYATFCELGERIKELREKYRLLSGEENEVSVPEEQGEILALERRLMQLSQTNEQLYAQKTTLETTLAELRSYGDPSRELAELSGQNEQGLLNLFEQYRNLEMALEHARDAQDRFEKSFKAPIAEEINNLLSFVLEPGESFEFGDRFDLRYKRGDRRFALSEAGGGLSELASLAMRFCVARRAISHNIPLVFDESFTYIDERSKRALSDLLNEKQAQTLIFASGSDIVSAFSAGAVIQTFGSAL
ncbi:MAG: AAA family ATPase [Clostridia bacterium]|nr:AAA family ATPase [Clostridia bacterium]